MAPKDNKGGGASVGRIKNFDNRWNARQVEIISKEDKLRRLCFTKQMEIMEASGVERIEVALPRAHSCIGPFPGQRRNAPLSPRKSASSHYLDQKLLRSSASGPLELSARDMIYEEGGRKKYLKMRYDLPITERFGEKPITATQDIGFVKPMGEYRASHFCHKPGVESAFNRPNGVMTYLGLPPMNK